MHNRRLLATLVTTAGTALGTAVLAVPAATATPLVETYIVTFDAPPTADALEMLTGVSIGVHGFQHVPAAAVTASPLALPVLRNLPGVRRVYTNEIYQPLLSTSTRTIKADRAWNDYGVTGEGVSVAVIDAGVDGAHPDLCARIELCRGTPVKLVENVKLLGREDKAPGSPVVALEDQISTDSSSGHGSHVASIAAGAGSASETPGRYRGVAPGASLVGYGTGEAIEAVNVLAAFDHAIAHRDEFNIRVINNSWGPGAFTNYDPDHPVNLATDAAWNAGISVVFGSGNDGTRSDSLNMFSVHPRSMSVAGGRKDGHLAFFSSRGIPGSPLWHPTVTAPGEYIAAAKATTGFTIWAADAQTAGGTSADAPAAGSADSTWYATSSGTSMASPHVAGVVALMQEASHDARGVWLTPQEVRNIMQNTATRTLPNYQAHSMGAGYVNALAAVEAARAGTHTQTYDDGMTYDVATFAGSVGAGAIVSTSTYTTEFPVAAGAESLEVMVDWGPEKVLPANTDVDIAVFNPLGQQVFDSFLRCDPNGQPNGYSSFCSSAPNERYTAATPMAGTWRTVVRGSTTAAETVRGMWSAAYADGTAPAPAQSASSLTMTASATTSLQGQPVDLTATVLDAAGRPVPNAVVSWTSAGAGGVSHAETYTDSLGRAVAKANSDAPGTQQVRASVGSLTADAGITWLGIVVPPLPCVLNCPPPPPASTPGKASGGGWWRDSGGGKDHFGVTAEFNRGASSPGGSVSFDDKAGTTVTSDVIESLVISGNRATVTGPANVNGESGYQYTLTLTDNGEPGRDDTVSLVVTKGSYRLQVGGTLGGGNLQVRAGS